MGEQQIQLGGCVTFWKPARFYFAGSLLTAFDALGFKAHQPHASTHEANLRFALSETITKPELMIRPKKKGFAIVQETRGDVGTDNYYLEKCAFWLDDPTQQGGNPVLRMSPWEQVLAVQVADSYKAHHSLLTGASVTKALVAVCGQLNGLSLREDGAVYWIPGAAVPQWHSLSAAVEAASAKGKAAVYLIRHGFDADSIRAVRDGLKEEIKEEAERIIEDVSRAGDDALGARALAGRKQEAQSLKQKIALYESILGESLSWLTQKAAKAEEAAALAAVAHAGAKQAEAAAS